MNASASPTESSDICGPYPLLTAPTQHKLPAAAARRSPVRQRRPSLAVRVLRALLAARGHQNLSLGCHELVVVVMDRDRLAGDVTEIRLGLWLLRRVGHLAVHQDVAGHKLRFGYPQLHEQADPAQDQERNQRVPDDDGQCRTRLDEQLPGVTVE